MQGALAVALEPRSARAPEARDLVLSCRVTRPGQRVKSGYEAFAAFCTATGLDCHEADGLGFFPPRWSRDRVTLRVRVDEVMERRFDGIVGVTLRLAGTHVVVERQSTYDLTPASSLVSSLVVIAPAHETPDTVFDPRTGRLRYTTPEVFRVAVERQLADLDVRAQVVVGPMDETWVKGHWVRGHGVVLHGLDEADSLFVQAVGIGGRRRFGCGLFMPLRWGG